MLRTMIGTFSRSPQRTSSSAQLCPALPVKESTEVAEVRHN